MKLHRLFTAAIVIVLLVGTVSLPVAAEQVDAKGKIESLVLEELSTDGQTDFFVWMVAKADLSQANQFHSKLEKGKFVLNALRQTAERSQQGLRRYLDQQGVSYEAFYIANKILVRGGDLNMVNSLAARPDVAQISANHIYQLQEPYEDSPAPDDILAVGSNITFIKAPSAWSLGYTGQGTVLAGNDTGLDETHPAIARHYRGCQNPPTCTSWEHNYNWWDATGTYRTNPYDGHGHGTHTTGTMVGDDGGTNQIGVAPGAQTIHCKNMTDSGSGSDATFTTCFQWDLAPWDLNGQNANPAMAPDAINNSWGYSGGNNPIFRDEIQALHAAGILVEVSAGNEGPGCATLRSPSDYWEVLTTGSVNHTAPFPGSLTGFSSRGPSACDGTVYPELVAPGGPGGGDRSADTAPGVRRDGFLRRAGDGGRGHRGACRHRDVRFRRGGARRAGAGRAGLREHGVGRQRHGGPPGGVGARAPVQQAGRPDGVRRHLSPGPLVQPLLPDGRVAAGQGIQHVRHERRGTEDRPAGGPRADLGAGALRTALPDDPESLTGERTEPT